MLHSRGGIDSIVLPVIYGSKTPYGIVLLTEKDYFFVWNSPSDQNV
jgi:hypothetical protein